MRAERVFGLVWLAFSAAMAWVALDLKAPISYEPVGPRAVPLLYAGLMAACALTLVLRPHAVAFHWPHGKVVHHIVVSAGLLLGYAFAFEWLGFPLATALLALLLGRVFGGSWRTCASGGVAMGIVLYLFFDRLLDVVLPLGLLQPLFGG